MHNLGRLFSYVRPHRVWLATGGALMILVGLLEGATALLVGPLLQLVLEPTAARQDIVLLALPYLNRTYYLQDLLPLPVATAARLLPPGDRPAGAAHPRAAARLAPGPALLRHRAVYRGAGRGHRPAHPPLEPPGAGRAGGPERRLAGNLQPRAPPS